MPAPHQPSAGAVSSACAPPGRPLKTDLPGVGGRQRCPAPGQPSVGGRTQCPALGHAGFHDGSTDAGGRQRCPAPAGRAGGGSLLGLSLGHGREGTTGAWGPSAVPASHQLSAGAVSGACAPPGRPLKTDLPWSSWRSQQLYQSRGGARVAEGGDLARGLPWHTAGHGGDRRRCLYARQTGLPWRDAVRRRAAIPHGSPGLWARTEPRRGKQTRQYPTPCSTGQASLASHPISSGCSLDSRRLRELD